MLDLKISNKFQEAGLSMLVHRQITREHFTELKNSFLTLDTDLDGKISVEEFKTGFDMFYKDPFAQDETTIKKNLELLFARCDLDSDGYICWHEFLMVASDKS